MLLKIFGVVAVAVVGLLGYVAAQSSDYSFTRDVMIDAKPEVIFPYLDNAKKMNEWNPWMKVDPNVKINYAGPESGIGAESIWEGNSDTGKGSSKITESHPYSSVKMHLEFIEPMAGMAEVDFILKPEKDQTRVVWQFRNKNTFLSRLFCVFMNMDKMMGDMFDKGLQELKSRSEAAL